MSNAARCVIKHLGKNSPIYAYRADMAGDVDELIEGGMARDDAWLRVVDAKIADLRAEKVRIEQSVADAYAKTAAGKAVNGDVPAAARKDAEAGKLPSSSTDTSEGGIVTPKAMEAATPEATTAEEPKREPETQSDTPADDGNADSPGSDEPETVSREAAKEPEQASQAVPEAAEPAAVEEGTDPGSAGAPAEGVGRQEPATGAVEATGLKKPTFVSKEDGEHLFGIPAKRQKALERIAKGTAYFGAKDKARDFITGNGLKDTHEAVETKPGRFEVREKGAAAAPAVAEKAIDRRNRLKAERALPEAKPNMGLPTNEQVEADKAANPQDWGPSLNRPNGAAATPAQQPQAVTKQAPQSDFSELEKSLQGKAHADEQPGDVGVVVGGGDVQYVSMDDAVVAARAAIAAGVAKTPFQIHNNTGIRLGDVGRVLKEAESSAPAAEVDPLDAELQDALGKLGDVLGDVFGGKLNMMPAQYSAADLLPALSKVVELLVRKGFKSFAQATAKAAQVMRANAATAPHVDAISPRQWKAAYNAIADGHEGTDSEEVLGALTAADVKTLVAEKAEDVGTQADKGLTTHMAEAIRAGNMPKDNLALRKLVQEFDGKVPTPARMKAAQEALEAAVVAVAREAVAKKEGPRSTFDVLTRLYESQPLLNVRTSTSIENQAYSTPAPLAFIASQLAGINAQSTVYEPTAGNGMLLIGANPANTHVNELNDARRAELTAQGFKTTTPNDATEFVPSEKFDAVITNPPFGPIKSDAGESVKVKVDGYTMGQVDHLIAARALSAMKEDGKAVLIIGANKAPGRQSLNDRVFFNWLYGRYNVTSHFEVDGKMYERQGASWPVRVISIDGRLKSNKTAPMPESIKRVSTWSEVYDKYQQSLDSTGNPAGAGATAGRAAPDDKPGARGVSGAAGVEAGRSDQGRPAGSARSAGDVAGAGAGTVVDRRAAAGERLGSGPDAQRSDDRVAAKADRQGNPDGSRASKPAGDAGASGLATTDNPFQASYVPRSGRKDEGVLIPVNMAGPTQDALNSLEDKVGDIDEFARQELGYKSVADLHNALMGLQVDSVASAIHQIKEGKGVIIADQTGIGKGRQAASIIRWAVKNDKVPVFITVKPSLFTDMNGDLTDIGTTDVAPFIMNVDEAISGPGGERLFANRKGGHRAALEKIAQTGQLPQGRNAVFMTYSQINVANAQRDAVMALAPNAVFVLDESHNAGGDSATGEFIRDALGLASGVTYLSATYAKRPDNMPVYFKTDIGEATSDDGALRDAMAAGGLPLQTVVAANLVKAGQMFRRERSYDGVSIESRADVKHKAEHAELSDRTTLALRAIVRADRMFHEIFVKALQKEIKAQGEGLNDVAGNQIAKGVDHTEFSSVVHNFVRQMLLGLKAQEAADEAIASLKRGEKPLIAVENTMGSFLAEYADANNIKPGDPLGSFDYRNVLSRALERTRYIVRVLPNGDKQKEYIPLSRLDAVSAEAYKHAQEIIDGLKISIPVSPIDWMRQQIIGAGYTVAEITGRSLKVDYSDPAKPVLDQIDPRERSDKVNTTRQFNAGKLDAIILNVAGSTGISLHASEKFTDQRQRHMIVAQPAQDINIFMQMLGRIHRTGQVALPKYTLLSADLPAEIRPTALLSGKMKSLNANTSSNTESATSVKTADMLNKYGDQVVAQYLADNPELKRALGVEVGEEGSAEPDVARKATGRLALMPVAVQQQFYAEVEEQYQALIDYLNKTNQNELEPRTMDFDAQELTSALLFQGPNPDSPFGQDANYGEYSVKAQGKAMTPDEIREAIAASLNGKTAQAHVKELTDRLNAGFDAMLTKMGEDDAKAIAAARITRDTGVAFIQSHAIGALFRIDINGDLYNAVVTNIRSTHKAAGNPYSLSKIQVTLAVNGALRSVTVPATQFRKIEVNQLYGYGSNIDQLFRAGPTNERQVAKIVTGNLLGAYGELDGSKGSIINFTRADGSIDQGILLPKAFDFKKDARQDYRLRTGADAFKFVTTSTDENIGRFGINSRDGVVRVMPNRGEGIIIQVPKSKAKGGKFFLDPKLRAFTGDFVSSGNTMRAYVDDQANAIKALDHLINKQALYALPSMAKEAREILGDTLESKPGDTPAFSRSTTPKPIERSPRVAKLETLVAAIVARWKNAPEVVVVESLDDPRVPQAVRDEGKAQQSQGAQGEPEGFFHDGKVYLVAPQLGGDADVVRVLFHEALGHYGLRGTFGPELGTILDRLAVLNAGKVRAKAKQYGLDYDKPSDRRMAAEEVLAEMAQKAPDVGWAKKAVAAIRTWLRQHVPGFGKMAFSDDEIVRSFILPARAFVQRGRGSIGGAVAFSRSDADLTRPSISEPPQAGSVEDERRWVRETSAALRRYADALTGKENPVYPGKVEHSGSAAGPSSYFKLGAQEVRVSLHSKGAFNSQFYLPVFDAESAGRVLDHIERGAADFAQKKAEGRNVYFSRSTIGDAVTNFSQAGARNAFLDAVTTHGSTNFWGRTVGTQYHKAQTHPRTFGRVFDAVQDYIKDTSVFANRAADLAPSLLPKLDTWRDLVKDGPLRHGADPKDTAKAGEAIFQGTLNKELYDDVTLRSRFGLNDKQVELYREFRSAVDQSLEGLGKTEILRIAGEAGRSVRADVLAAPTLEDAAEILTAAVAGDAETAQQIAEKVQRIEQLQNEGYAPLMRFGKHTLHVTGPGGSTEFFGMYETVRDANRAARQLRADPGMSSMTFAQGVMSQEEHKLFSGLSLDSLELFADTIGEGDNPVYQEYLKHAIANRSALKRMIERKGTAGYSEDVSRVLASFVTSNARMSAGHLHLTDAKKAAEAIPKEQGDLRDDAIKLVEYVTNPAEEAAAARGLLFTSFIGGSVASALVNMTQPITMTLPYLTQFGGAAKAGKRLTAAMAMVASGKGMDAGLADALKRAESDGIVSPQEIHHLQAEAMNTLGKNPMLKKAAFVWGAMFSLAEQFNRRVSFVAAYQTAQQEGIANPFAFAEKAVIETQGLYNKGNKAQWARGAIGATAMTFKQFSTHYLEFLTRMWKSGPEGKKAVAVALALLILMGGAGGLPFADDLDDLIDTLGQAMGHDTNAKRWKRQFVAKTLGLGDAAGDVATRGLTALPGFPLDLSVRLGMGNLLPATGMFLRSNTDTSKQLLEFAGAAGALASNALDGGKRLLGGDVGGAVMSAMPMAVQNMAKGVQMAMTGEYRNAKGAKVMDVDATDAAMKFIGFQPAEVARESGRVSESLRSTQLAKNVESEIAGQWAQAMVDGDADGVAKARRSLADWNEANPSAPIKITRTQVLARVKALKSSRADRTVKAAPKEMRATVRESLQ